MIGLAFGPTNSAPLESNTEKEDIVAQGRVRLCDPLYVEWNRSQNLTLTLHRLNSPKYIHTYDGDCSLCIIGKLLLKGV